MMFCWLRNAKHVQVISPVSIQPAQQHISNFYLGEAFTNALHDIKTLNISPWTLFLFLFALYLFLILDPINMSVTGQLSINYPDLQCLYL